MRRATSRARIRILRQRDAARGAHARATRCRVPRGSARHHNGDHWADRVRNVARVFRDFLSETCVVHARHRHPVPCYDPVIYAWRGFAAVSPQLVPLPKKWVSKKINAKRSANAGSRISFARSPLLFPLSLFLPLSSCVGLGDFTTSGD